MPTSSRSWIYSAIPQKGLLDGEIAYLKHGAGCEVYFPDGAIDFDFGAGGEINGIDEWRLSQFAKDKLLTYGFASQEALDRCFEMAVNEGHLIRSEDHLFYVANCPRALAIDLDSRLPGDTLPTRNLDIVLVLECHYFQAAELMLENYDNLYRKWKKNNTLSNRKIVDLRIYLSSWLGFIAVTCEGFESIGMRSLLRGERPPAFGDLVEKSDALGSMIKCHRNALENSEIRLSIFEKIQKPSEASSLPMQTEWPGRAIYRMHSQFFLLPIG